MNKNNLVIRLKGFILKKAYLLGKNFGFNKNFISVVCYHGISNSADKYSTSLSNFKKQIQEINNHAKFIGLQEIGQAFNGEKIKDWGVHLTIDDGYENVEKIIPFLKGLKIPVTLFVLSDSGKVDRGETGNYYKLLSIKKIKQLHKLGWTIGCHGATHANLSRLTKPELIKEIIDSKKNLEKILGFKVDCFAYPKGIFTKQALELVKRAGYKMAFTTEAGAVNQVTDNLLIPRTVIDKSKQLSDFPYFFSETTFYIRRVIDQLKIWKFLLAFQGGK